VNCAIGIVARPPPAAEPKVVVGIGISSPRFSVSVAPSWPRRFGFAIRRVFASLSRKRTIALGTVR
jgi:hypothetical protein